MLFVMCRKIKFSASQDKRHMISWYVENTYSSKKLKTLIQLGKYLNYTANWSVDKNKTKNI